MTQTKSFSNVIGELPELALLCGGPHHGIAWFALERAMEFGHISESGGGAPLADGTIISV